MRSKNSWNKEYETKVDKTERNILEWLNMG